MRKYIWPVAIVVATIALAACGNGSGSGSVSATVTVTASSPSSASATASPPASPSPSTSPALPASAFTICTNPIGAATTCAGTMKTRPGTILTSGDGSTYVYKLVWSGWGGATTTATGLMEVDNCTPTCAGGTFTGYPATVTATGLTSYSGGEQAYATFSISAPAAPSPANSYSYTNAVP